MKKRIVLWAVCVMACVMSVDAQVVFTKFKFFVADINDFRNLKLEMKFKATGERDLKYVKVGFVAVNKVGDAVSALVVGAVNANVKPTKRKIVEITGPLRVGDGHTQYAGSYFYPWTGKKVVAFPYEVVVDYMGGGSDTIQITRENIGTFFPSVKWMDVDYESGL